MLSNYLTGRLVVVKDNKILPEEREIVTIPYGSKEVAVFGPDYESVEDYIKQLELEELEDSSDKMEEIDSFTFNEGKFRKTALSVSSDYVIHRHSSSALNDLRVRVWENNGKYHVETSTQWPLEVRRQVAKTLELEIDKVVLHSVHYHDRFDEYLSEPTKAAVIASLAAKKSGLMAELIVTPFAVQPQMKISITSAIDKNKNCKALKINASVDLGRDPKISKEYLLSLASGLVPVYKLSAIEMEIKAYKSEHDTAEFYSDLGYSIGLAAIENHFSKVAHKLDMQPTEWRMKNIFKNRFAEQFRKSSQFASLKQTLEECTQASCFERKYSVGSHGVNPFINYARGIGVSCGEGTQGFSNQFPEIYKYSITMTVSEDKKVKISCGLVPDLFLGRILTDIVKNNLDPEIDSVTFGENQNVDFGPSVLGRKVKYIPLLVEKCCKELKGKELPCSASVSFDCSDSDYLFESDTFGTLVLELHIDPVMLVPVVDHIFARIKFGKIYNKIRIQRMIRQVISSTVKEICPVAENNFDIDLVVESDENFPAGSASSLIRGLTIASFTSAVSQALKHDLKTIPLQDNDILEITVLNNED